METNISKDSVFEFDWMRKVHINKQAVTISAEHLLSRQKLTGNYKIAFLLRAVTCVDLTTLSGDDCPSNVKRMCDKARHPLHPDILKKFGFDFDSFTVAAVCVYPARVSDCKGSLGPNSGVPIASVATGFPTGQYSLSTRLDEIRFSVSQGASEIDVVINRTAALTGDWKTVYDEIRQMKAACGDGVLMKTILAVGELGTYANIYKASMVAMMAGSDFIKTSTGKETVNATIPIGIVMCRAISDFYEETGKMVGLKPAGGLRKPEDALNWMLLVHEYLGSEWLNSRYFRIGASALLGEIETLLYELATGVYPRPNQLQ